MSRRQRFWWFLRLVGASEALCAFALLLMGYPAQAALVAVGGVVTYGIGAWGARSLRRRGADDWRHSWIALAAKLRRG